MNLFKAILWLFVLGISGPLAFSQTTPDTFSPIVSYQYQESLSESGTTTPVSSPAVSFQYYEWPGDENLSFTNSPQVSFYYNGPPAILIQPIGQVVKVGATAILSVSAIGSQPLFYQWRINGVSISGANGSALSLANIQSGDSGSYTVTVQNAYGETTSSEAKIFVYFAPATPQPTPPQSVQATQTPSSIQTTPPRVPSNTQLKVLSQAASMDPSKMTIVMTHGWNDSYTGWPTQMGNALSSLYGTNVNIVAWDWHENASLNHNDPAPSAARVPSEGEALGQALLDTLGAGYNMPIHFIGHSLGTMVNCRAADYIHGDCKNSPCKNPATPTLKFNPANTQMTLLDEAELVSAVKGLHVDWDYLVAKINEIKGSDDSLQLNDAAIYSISSKVIPDESAWIDNYFSIVGRPHPEAANLMLWRNTFSTDPAKAHGYAIWWYMQTVSNPNISYFGHFWSFESNTMGSTARPAPDSFFSQDYTANVSEFALLDLSGEYGASLPNIMYYGLEAAKAYQLASQVQSAGVTDVVQYLGNMSASIVQMFTATGGNPVYLDTAGSTPALVVAPGQNIPTTFQANWGIEFSLQPGSAQPQHISNAIRAKSLSDAGTNGAANSIYTIIPVYVPTEAIGLSFEYQISGAAPSDFMTMGMGTANNYTMEAKYVDDSSWNGTPVIQVSDYRNQNVQLVFAMNGVGVPPTGTLSIRNIQFYIPPRPKLELSMTGGLLTASWPLSAVDWTLEASPDLSPDSWQAISSEPLDTDYNHTMTFDISHANKQFFRLGK
jgi:Immunoglobulin domain/Lipase